MISSKEAKRLAVEYCDYNGQTFEFNDVGLAQYAAVVYAAGAEQARQDYEREHCRHAVPLTDALAALISDAVTGYRDGLSAAPVPQTDRIHAANI